MAIGDEARGRRRGLPEPVERAPLEIDEELRQLARGRLCARAERSRREREARAEESPAARVVARRPQNVKPTESLKVRVGPMMLPSWCPRLGFGSPGAPHHVS
jgi:hypothetical protein